MAQCNHQLHNRFAKFNCLIFDVEEINTHGGSLRVYVTRDRKKKIKKNVNFQLKKERESKLNKITTYKKFSRDIEILKKNTIANIQLLKKKYKKIYGYGAPAKATTLLNYFKISDNFEAVFDDTKSKINKFIPGTKIKIISKKNVRLKFV